MQFSNLSDFMDMGGYGFYVWSSFTITFVSMLWIVIDNILTRRKIFIEINKKIARDKRVEEAKNMENIL